MDENTVMPKETPPSITPLTGFQVKPFTDEERKAASSAWVELPKLRTFEKSEIWQDDFKKVKVVQVKRYAHRLSKDKTTPTKVSRSLCAVYKTGGKLKNRWLKVAGDIPVERLEKLTGIKL